MLKDLGARYSGKGELSGSLTILVNVLL